jgi:hypothetical protein
MVSEMSSKGAWCGHLVFVFEYVTTEMIEDGGPHPSPLPPEAGGRGSERGPRRSRAPGTKIPAGDEKRIPAGVGILFH